jgi:Uma2 family endonuclease
MTDMAALREPAPFRWPPGGRPFTVEDLAWMPRDGRRYEVIDGMLHVAPSEATSRQRVAFVLARTLDEAAPGDIWCLPAPVHVLLGSHTDVQPDVVVAYRARFSERGVFGTPLLVVEVLSPGTALHDEGKRGVYEEEGVPAYWVVDPGVPSLRAWELREGAYAEVAHVTGDEPFEATVPFPVTVVPWALLD